MIVYIFVIAGVLVGLRTLIGPSFADRVIGVSALMNIVVFYIVFYSIEIGSQLYLDIALVIVLLSFVGTLAIAKFAVKK